MNNDDLAFQYEQERVAPNDELEVALAEMDAAEAAEQPEPIPTVDQEAVEQEDADGGFFSTAGDVMKAIPGGFLEATAEMAESLESAFPALKVEGAEPLRLDKPETAAGGLVSGVSQFLTGFIPAMKGFKAIGIGSGIKTAMGAGALTDAFAFDPHEERLSNLVEEYPMFANPVTDYLSAKPEDSEAEGRFKNALEGLGLGAAIDGLFKSIKWMKSYRENNIKDLTAKREKIQLDKKAEDEIADELIAPEELPAARIEEKLGEGDAIALKEVTDEEVDSIISDVGPVKPDEKAININLNRIDSEDDIKNVLKQTGEIFADSIDESRRGKISLEETEKLADNLGMSVQDLMARNKGEAFNAEQAVAARKLLVASGDKLVQLAQKAARTDATPEDKFALLKASKVHRAIQEQVSGLTAEAGRALSSFRVMAKSQKAQQEQIAKAIEDGGKSVDDMIDALSMAETPAQVSQIIETAAKAGWKDVVVESWYSSLLSGLSTQVVNMMGSGINVFWNAGSRYVTPSIGRAMGDQTTTIAEANQAIYGMVKGMKDGFVIAGKALKSSDFEMPGSVMERKSGAPKRAITKETFNATGIKGQAIDILGSVIRTPTRMLTAGDVFFKEVNKRMEIQALAYRQAMDEGLKGDAAAKRMADILNSPTDNMLKQAEQFSQVQTFTNDLGQFGKSLQTAAQSNTFARVLLPFIRTPINIVKQVGLNSPVAPFMDSFKQNVKAGGARRDRALAQMSMGSMTMAVVASEVSEGNISGSGPSNYDAKRVLELTGWKPYSIKVGDTWYSYQRADPIGMTIGLAADIAQISGSTDEADLLDMGAAGVIAVAQNLTSKTYLAGLSDFMGALTLSQSDPDKENRHLKRWMHKTAASFVPFSSLQGAIAREIDPTLRMSSTFVDKVKSRTPGFSADLPAVVNIFGEPVVLTGGVGPDIMSPIYSSQIKEDFVVDELVRLEVPVAMPPRTIYGIRLTDQEYHDYATLAGKEVKAGGLNYKQQLSKQMKKSSYKNSTDEKKKLYVKAVTEDYREAASKTYLKNNPEFRARYTLQKADQRKALRGY